MKANPGQRRYFQTSDDPLSMKNVCDMECQLKEITFDQLAIGQVQAGTVVWVKTIAEACSMSSVSLVVEDQEGHAFQLFLYNSLDKRATLS